MMQITENNKPMTSPSNQRLHPARIIIAVIIGMVLLIVAAIMYASSH
jgi:hypothetical protein